MIMQQFSLHTHTKSLDGCHTVLQMVEEAQRIGYTSLGISEHFIVHPLVKQSNMYQAAKHPSNPKVKPYDQIYSASFDEAIGKIQSVFDEIDSLNQSGKIKIPLYKGLEADFFEYSGWDKGFERALDILKPNYVIGSCHFSVLDDKIFNMHDILKQPSEMKDLLIADYWRREQNAAKSGYFDFLAHSDLYKRHGIGTEPRFIHLERQTMDVLNQSKVAVEINTSSLNKAKYQHSDFLQLLSLIAEFNIPTLLSDDAHSISDLGQNYQHAEELAKDVGIKHFCKPTIKKNRFILERFEKQRD